MRPDVVFGLGEGGDFTNLARAQRRRGIPYPGRRDAVKSGWRLDELVNATEFVLTAPTRANGEPIGGLFAGPQ